MLALEVGLICEATGATQLCGDPNTVAKQPSIDSRTVTPEGLFVAFQGERVDGNNYAGRAIEAGAACVVVTRAPEEALVQQANAAGCALVRAQDDDGQEFLLRLAAAWRKKHPQWCVLGVTGSVGKTTTKDMLAAACSAAYVTHATKGNFNNLIGLPLTLLTTPDDAQVVVAEMGMNHPGEIHRLSEVARPCCALITNIGTSHIGLLGSRENIARAKAEIVDGMDQASLEGMQLEPSLHLWAVDDFSDFIATNFAQKAGIAVTFVGGHDIAIDSTKAAGFKLAVDASDVTTASAQLHASNVQVNPEGFVSCEVCYPDGMHIPATLPIPGKHLLSDFLLALSVADSLGINRQASIEAIQQMPQTHMRLELVGGGDKPRMIDDSYNASPTSMAAALDVLCSLHCEGRRIAVLGEMGEMGSQAARLHDLVGAYAAAKPLDMLVLIGATYVEGMRQVALVMGFSDDKIEIFKTVDEALHAIKPILTKDDVVLAKASRSSALDLFVKGVLE